MKRAASKKRQRKSEADRLKEALIFIDTNIFLNFYRMNVKGDSIDWLKKIDENRDRIITTCQVEMEFKKNRQKILMESIQNFKVSEVKSPPAFIAGEAKAKKIEEEVEKIAKLVKELKVKMSQWLNIPETHDQIYKCLQRLFKAESQYRLDRNSENRQEIKRKAGTRFSLGYPPRKKTTLLLAMLSTGNG